MTALQRVAPRDEIVHRPPEPRQQLVRADSSLDASDCLSCVARPHRSGRRGSSPLRPHLTHSRGSAQPARFPRVPIDASAVKQLNRNAEPPLRSHRRRIGSVCGSIEAGSRETRQPGNEEGVAERGRGDGSDTVRARPQPGDQLHRLKMHAKCVLESANAPPPMRSVAR